VEQRAGEIQVDVAGGGDHGRVVGGVVGGAAQIAAVGEVARVDGDAVADQGAGIADAGGADGDGIALDATAVGQRAGGGERGGGAVEGAAVGDGGGFDRKRADRAECGTAGVVEIAAE